MEYGVNVVQALIRIVLDLVVFLGSHVYVATAHAEEIRHSSVVPIGDEMLFSATYNTLVQLLTVLSRIFVNEGWISLVIYLAVLAMQVSIVWQFSWMTVKRYKEAT